MSKRLIVNADDLGLSAATNRAILAASQRGIVTSTTALVNMPGASEGIQQMQRLAPEIGLGLHVNLTEGRPVLAAAQVPSLVQAEGIFVGGRRTLWAMRKWQVQEVAAEVKAQFDRFVEISGRAPDHLDSHHFVANYSAACLEACLVLASEHDLPMRKTDHTLLEIMAGEPNNAGAGQRLLAALLKPWFRSQLTVYRRHPRPWTTDRFEVSFYGRGATLKRLLQILARMPAGLTEIMCHPGYVQAPERGERPNDELAILTDGQLRETIERQKIKLVSYADLGK
jgi:predicted glycoside hydrolase/deacetylase ChbG (UPF0249 family)